MAHTIIHALLKTACITLTALSLANCSGDSSSNPAIASPGIAGTPTNGDVPPLQRSVIEIENAKAGTDGWKLSNPSLAHEIEGYASLTSVNKGGRIDFYINTSAASYNIDIYRMGYYAGAGARLMQSHANIGRQPQRLPCANPDNVIECDWAVSHSLSIPLAVREPASLDYWASGIYLAKLSTNTTPVKDSYIIFVVRDDERTASYVSQLPVTTYQAYNFWGGKSLYTGCDNPVYLWSCQNGASPAVAVSFNRPYGRGVNPASAHGVGAGEFITNVQPAGSAYNISNAAWDYNMVRWMERQGYDIKYISNLDLHENPAVLENAMAFISTGHDEYYSKPMWDRLVAAKSSGINLAFFSSNQIFWQVRFNDGSYGDSKRNRIMICYRGGGDPVADNMLTTNKFRFLGRPEGALIGNQYVRDPIVGDVTVSNADHWLFSGTGATNAMALPGLLGYEINAHVPGISPPQTRILAHSISDGFAGDMTYYVDASSAQVFATGTMQWSWGLDDFIPNGLRSDFTHPVAQAFTRNLFDALGEQHNATLAHAATSLDLSIPAGDLNGAKVILNARPGNKSRTNQWRLIAAGTGSDYYLVARANGLCLQALGAMAGAEVGTQDCKNTGSQQWQLRDAGNGTVTLSEKTSGLCLSAADGAAGAGSILSVLACGNSQRQHWRRAAAA